LFYRRLRFAARVRRETGRSSMAIAAQALDSSLGILRAARETFIID
jgi:hypothetical protein